MNRLPCYPEFLSVLALMTIGLLSSPWTVHGQSLTIPNTPDCAKCRIVFTKDSVVIGDAEHPPGDYTSAMTRDRSGRVIVLQDREVPWTYDQNGRYLGSVGRLGDGPGEYRSPFQVVTGPGDSLLILDEALHRISILTPSLRFVRSAQAPAWTSSALWMDNGELLVSGVMPDSRTVGLAVHRFSATGVHLGSFGDLDRPYSVKAPHLGQRLLCALPDRRLLAVSKWQGYTIERWTLEGELEGRWTRMNPWFGAFPSEASRQAPPAYVSSVLTDPQGRLWVHLLVPDKRWRQAVRERTSETGEKYLEAVDPDLIYDSVVEVIDLRRGSLVVQASFDPAFFRMLSPRHMVTIVELSDGSKRIVIREMSLVVPS